MRTTAACARGPFREGRRWALRTTVVASVAFLLAAGLLSFCALSGACTRASSGAAGLPGRAPTLGFTTAQELIRAYIASPLPPRNSNITEETPLTFFHQRKAAGSSTREALAGAAAAANLSLVIACYGGLPCDTYALGHEHQAAVYAGHFYWGRHKSMPRAPAYSPDKGTGHVPRRPASCLTLFREPVARLQSCYYYRFVDAQTSNHSGISDPRYHCLSDLTPGELRSSLIHGRFRYGRGCLSEPFRTFSGLKDEAQLAQLATRPTDSHLSVGVLALTLEHLAECVPLVLEEPATLSLARHWFPQLAPAFEQLPKLNRNEQQRCPLTVGARKVLEELTAGEALLYEAAWQRAAAMLVSLEGEGADA